jgi:hypothetical protein
MSSVFADAIGRTITKQYEVMVKVTVHANNPADAIRRAMNVDEHKAVTITDVREVEY